jgi:hypothetical protein
MRFARRSPVPEGMIPAADLEKRSRRGAAAPPDAVRPGLDPELVAMRDRLIERFALGQADLGGVYYEMAIRDHVREDVLAAKAAELQRVEVELAQVERILRGEAGSPAGSCPVCAALAGSADVFCSQCGKPLST